MLLYWRASVDCCYLVDRVELVDLAGNLEHQFAGGTEDEKFRRLYVDQVVFGLVEFLQNGKSISQSFSRSSAVAGKDVLSRLNQSESFLLYGEHPSDAVLVQSAQYSLVSHELSKLSAFGCIFLLRLSGWFC